MQFADQIQHPPHHTTPHNTTQHTTPLRLRALKKSFLKPQKDQFSRMTPENGWNKLEKRATRRRKSSTQG
jgi:hypothetical protein